MDEAWHGLEIAPSSTLSDKLTIIGNDQPDAQHPNSQSPKQTRALIIRAVAVCPCSSRNCIGDEISVRVRPKNEKHSNQTGTNNEKPHESTAALRKVAEWTKDHSSGCLMKSDHLDQIMIDEIRT